MLKSTTRLKQQIQMHETLIAPGAFDGLSARLVEQAGFRVIYASGGAIARSCGFPDLGLLSVTEVCTRLEQMIEITDIPIIADADTGFGNVINTRRTVKAYQRLGVAALHLEDQEFPKRCGHLNHKRLISQAEMTRKICVAKESLDDDDFTLIARTDAIAVEGLDRAIERALAYVQAGADMIFVEAPESQVQIEQIAKAIQAPKLINMFYGGKTPLVAVERLKALGYQIIIIPSDLQRAAIHAMQCTLSVVKTQGDSRNIADQLVSFKEREALIDTAGYLALDRL